MIHGSECVGAQWLQDRVKPSVFALIGFSVNNWIANTGLWVSSRDGYQDCGIGKVPTAALTEDYFVYCQELQPLRKFIIWMQSVIRSESKIIESCLFKKMYRTWSATNNFGSVLRDLMLSYLCLLTVCSLFSGYK